jgi:hypothetical protein
MLSRTYDEKYVMSPLHDEPITPPHADSDIPLRPTANSIPPTSTLAKSATTTRITSQQVPAVDITQAFTAAASGIYQYGMRALMILLTSGSFEDGTAGQR